MYFIYSILLLSQICAVSLIQGERTISMRLETIEESSATSNLLSDLGIIDAM